MWSTARLNPGISRCKVSQEFYLLNELITAISYRRDAHISSRKDAEIHRIVEIAGAYDAFEIAVTHK